jgi:AcrR family transcriptional regulator
MVKSSRSVEQVCDTEHVFGFTCNERRPRRRSFPDDWAQMSGNFGAFEDMSTTLDRRTARTRRALRDALGSLLRRKSYDAITVQDIIDEADVGRSTFYAHCTGKDDLLRRGLQALQSELDDIEGRGRAPPDRPLTFSLKLLEHVDEYRDRYPALAHSRGREVILRELRQVALGLLRKDLDGCSFHETAPRQIIEQYVVGAFMALLVWWIETKPRYTTAQIDSIFQRLVLRGIRGGRQ